MSWSKIGYIDLENLQNQARNRSTGKSVIAQEIYGDRELLDKSSYKTSLLVFSYKTSSLIKLVEKPPPNLEQLPHICLFYWICDNTFKL